MSTTQHGVCGKCSEPIDRIDEPENPVLWTDGHRFQYTDGSRFALDHLQRFPDRPIYCIFRCDGCGEPINDNWRLHTIGGSQHQWPKGTR